LVLIVVVAGYVIGSFLTPRLFPLLPPQASAGARQVDELFRILLIIGGAIFLLVEGLLLYSVIRFRAQPGDTTDGPSIHGNPTLEVIWTAIPSVIVLVLVVLGYQVWVDIRRVGADGDLVNRRKSPST
jgi:heme/copper-type cytochrome/quinol oxidase subunit 2